MSRQRITGDAASTKQTATAAPTVYNKLTQDDAIIIPAGQAAGTPALTVMLNPNAADGDEIYITDAFGVLAAGTTLVVNGNGNFIADGAAAAATKTYNTAATRKHFMFSTQMQSGGTVNTGTWVSI